MKARPPDWSLTVADLMAEFRAGKRESVGSPEIDWARDYERSLFSAKTRFPKKGDIFEALKDQVVTYMTAWRAPFTGGGKAELKRGERVWIDHDPRDERPLGAYAIPMDYEDLEARIVPETDRNDPKYSYFYFYLSTLDLNSNFKLVDTDYAGSTKWQC